MESMAVRQYKQEGDKLYKENKYYEAIQCYSKAIDISDSNDHDLYLLYSNRCACFLSLNNYNHALSDAQACIGFKPTWPKGYNRLGSCLTRLNRNQEALNAYERALELDPNNSEASIALNKLHGTNYHNSPAHGNYASSAFNIWQQIKNTALIAYSNILSQWLLLPSDTKKYIQISAICIAIYYFLFYRSSSYSNHSSYYEYDYSPLYGGGTGLSWTAWGAVMVAAYKLPPMFPDLLGDNFAKPFFGMNWTTFMWLLNMLTAGQRHGGYGNVFSRRRKYY